MGNSLLLSSVIAMALSACAKKPETVARHIFHPRPKVRGVAINWWWKPSGLTMLWVLLQRRKTKRATTTLGVIFLGLPVSTLSGGNVAGQIAQLKGHKNTLEQTQIRKGCIKG